jgi:hypothetical protein
MLMDNDIRPPESGATPQPGTNIEPGQDNPQPDQEAKPVTPAPDLTPDPLDIHEKRSTKSFKKWTAITTK